jgi:hypothetical protein
VFCEKLNPLLITAWTEVSALISTFERSDEGTEIFMAAVRIGTLNPGNTFLIISTFIETFGCFLDADNPVLAVLFRIMIVVLLLKI